MAYSLISVSLQVWFQVNKAVHLRLQRNFCEEMLWSPDTFLIETLLLLREFLPLAFGTLSSIPASKQQVNMT